MWTLSISFHKVQNKQLTFIYRYTCISIYLFSIPFLHSLLLHFNYTMWFDFNDTYITHLQELRSNLIFAISKSVWFLCVFVKGFYLPHFLNTKYFSYLYMTHLEMFVSTSVKFAYIYSSNIDYVFYTCVYLPWFWIQCQNKSILQYMRGTVGCLTNFVLLVEKLLQNIRKS